MTEAEMIQRYKRGDTLADIARDAGLTTARISQIVVAAGVPRRRSTGTPELDAKIAALAKRDYTQVEIAAELEIGRRQVQRALERIAAGRERQRAGG